MRIGANIVTGDWTDMLRAAQEAERLGFDSIGTLDHYHTDKLEWPYVCGWSAYGAIAQATHHIRIVPMVIDRMNYLPGVLAKETAILSIISQGRFEPGIGAGDYFEEMHAWGLPVPDAKQRIDGLKETILALRGIWQGKQVTFEGEYLHLHNAASTPIPPSLPHVVVGAGSSRNLIHSAVEYADEINVYADDEIIRFVLHEIEASQRNIPLSVFVWDWPDNIANKLQEWEQLGIERTFLTFFGPVNFEPGVKFLAQHRS